MAIDDYNYNDSYFKDLRDDKRTIDAEDIDKQFTALVNYINNLLVPAINSINADVAAGVEGSPNALFQNNGVNGVSWSYISENSIIKDGEISWNKLSHSLAGSLIITNEAGVVSTIRPTATNQILQIAYNSNTRAKYISWEKISSRILENSSITGRKIALKTITAEHLFTPPTTLYGTVTSSKLVDGAVTSDKLAKRDVFALIAGRQDSTISISKIGVLDIDLPYLNANGLYQKIPSLQDALTNDKIVNNTLGYDQFCHVVGSDFANGIVITQETANRMAAGAITDIKLLNGGFFDDPRQLAYGAIIPATHIIDGSIDKNCFDAATKALFTAKGL